MGKALSLLLVEDQESDAALLLDQLRRFGYEVAWKRVETREAMEAALTAGAWDLVISDFSLPRFSAPEALSVRRELGSDLPFLIVSGTIQEEDAVECLRQGADDFITKGRLTRLGPAVERSLRESAERKARLLAEKRLQQAQKMEAIGQLAGGVAHDFNNLLGVILGYGELLMKDAPPEETRRNKRISEIMGAAQRAAALTRQLLAFSRQQPVETRSLDVNGVVAGLAPMLRALIGEHIEIATRLSDGLHLVKGNPVQIEQVLMNLGANARDAMESGGRLIIETSNVDVDDMYVLSHPDASPGPHVLLTVSDTGHGMDAETVARVFEPFFTTKEAGKGTGLGLASVYGIVRATGGHVGVYSEPGRGTTFKIYLPRTEHAPSAPPAPPPTEVRRPRSSETVLLLEDEGPLRDVIREVLQEDGYTVIDGPRPEETLATAERHTSPIHLLLTDLVMPRVSGQEAARRVRAARPDVRILYMSGYTPVGAEHQASLPEGHAYLQKPFSMDALLRKVRDVLDSASG